MSQIELKAEDLYDKDKVDIEEVDIDDVFKLLQCSDSGLDEQEAARRTEIFGPNRLEQKEQNPILQVSISPLSSRFLLAPFRFLFALHRLRQLATSFASLFLPAVRPRVVVALARLSPFRGPSALAQVVVMTRNPTWEPAWLAIGSLSVPRLPTARDWLRGCLRVFVWLGCPVYS